MSESWHSRNHEVKPSLPLKDRFEQILHTPVTVESISVFADKALNQLIVLNESVLEQYRTEYEDTASLSGRDLEDAAYNTYGLPDLNDILTQITKVQKQIQRLQIEVQSQLSDLQTIITPPDQNIKLFNGNNTNTYEAPEIKSRLLTLAYILEHDFDISISETEFFRGITSGDMVRQEPYVRILVPSLNRLIYICDEAGNASYVFNTEVLEHLGISPTDLDTMTKNQRNAFLRVTSEAGKRIVQTPKWRQEIGQSLSEPFLGQALDETLTSEFIENKSSLSYSDFITEVRMSYEIAGRPNKVKDWYRTEYKKHAGWPAKPERKYKDDGLISYVEMVGNEVKKIISFKEFQVEVRTAYAAAGRPKGVSSWYKNECNKHAGWPVSPDKTYKNDGLNNYAEMVGNEVKELLNFAEFVTEVRAAYQAANRPIGVARWYANEYKKHAGWTASPEQKYKNDGFVGYAEMVGKK